MPIPTHRLLLSIAMVFSVVGLYLQMAFLTTLSSQVLLPTIILGILTGGGLCCVCALWIIHHHNQGIVTLRFGALGVIAIAIVIFGIFSIKSLIGAGFFPHPCIWFSLEDIEACKEKGSIFQIIVEVSLVIFLFIWGLVYEKQIGHHLVYRIPFFERPE